MATPLEKAAAILNIKKEDLVQKGLKAYLKERLRELKAEITAIHLKYKVSSLEEAVQKKKSLPLKLQLI